MQCRHRRLRRHHHGLRRRHVVNFLVESLVRELSEWMSKWVSWSDMPILIRHMIQSHAPSQIHKRSTNTQTPDTYFHVIIFYWVFPFHKRQRRTHYYYAVIAILAAAASGKGDGGGGDGNGVLKREMNTMQWQRQRSWQKFHSSIRIRIFELSRIGCSYKYGIVLCIEFLCRTTLSVFVCSHKAHNMK